MRRPLSLLALLGLMLLGAPSAAAAATCADDSRHPGGVHPGGDWRLYGKDLRNTRHQRAETKIDREAAKRLKPLWEFSSVKAGGSGDFTGPPVVADGCVFAGSNGGWVFAVNADSGQRVWRIRLKGIISNAVAVPGDGRVYVGVTNVTDDPCAGPECDGPYVVALDQATGRELWRTRGPIDVQPGSDLYGSPVYFDPYGAGRTPAGGPSVVASRRRGGERKRRCTESRRRAFRLRWGPSVRRGDPIVSARIYVNGRLARRLRGRALRRVVVLRRLPRGRATVRLVGRTRSGRRIVRSRRYRVCRACARKRTIPMRRLAAKVPRGDRLVSASVALNGRRVRTLRDRALRGRLVLRGLPRGRVTMRLVGRTRAGRRVVLVRRWRVCLGVRAAAGTPRAAAGAPAPILLVGVSGWAAEDDLAGKVRYDWKGSFVILDAHTGEVLRKTWTMTSPETEDAFAGGSIWSTPSIDEESKVGYISTSNTFSWPESEHPHTNAIIKVGLDRGDPQTFGKILAAGKGTPDEYYTDYIGTPCRPVPPGTPPPELPADAPSEPACFDLDLAFGASPNLFRDKDGRLVVGAGQKSGVYHLFDATTMERLWKTELGPPSLIGGIVGSTAYDGEAIYGPTTVPATLWSLDPDAGARRWQFPMPGPANYGNMVAVANGVAYTSNGDGSLSARSTADGSTLLDVPLKYGTQTQAGTTVARNTVYAAIGNQGQQEGFIVALRPDAEPMPPQAEEESAPEEQQEGEEPPPGFGPTIIAPPNAQSTGYLTPAMITRVGGPLQFYNGDLAQHDVTADRLGPDGLPLFRSRRANNQEIVQVHGLDKVEPGTYGFFCSLHPGMKGNLQVTP